MPYEIHYDKGVPIRNPLQIMIVAINCDKLMIDKSFLNIAAKVAKNLGMTKLTVQLIDQYASFTKTRERNTSEKLHYEYYSLIEDITKDNSNEEIIDEHEIASKISKQFAARISHDIPLILTYDEGYAMEYCTDNRTVKSKGSALLDLLHAVRKFKGLDLDIYVSDSMKPSISKDELNGIQNVIRFGVPTERKNVICRCPYRSKHSTCQNCIHHMPEVELGMNLYYMVPQFNYDLEEEVNKGQAAAQRYLDKIRSDSIRIHCVENATKVSEKVLFNCNTERKTWNGVFDFHHPSKRESVLAVAVGLKLNFKEMNELMKTKGLLIDVNTRLIDAVVAYYCKASEPEIKECYDVHYINSVIAALGSKQFLGSK